MEINNLKIYQYSPDIQGGKIKSKYIFTAKIHHKKIVAIDAPKNTIYWDVRNFEYEFNEYHKIYDDLGTKLNIRLVLKEMYGSYYTNISWWQKFKLNIMFEDAWFQKIEILQFVIPTIISLAALWVSIYYNSDLNEEMQMLKKSQAQITIDIMESKHKMNELFYRQEKVENGIVILRKALTDSLKTPIKK